MERVIIRIENYKKYAEYGHPLLIFPDAPVNRGFVLYASFTGHGEGEYSALIEQSRPITESELESYHGNIYGYDLSNFKIVKRNKRSRNHV